jgi:hypothetical protein
MLAKLRSFFVFVFAAAAQKVFVWICAEAGIVYGDKVLQLTPWGIALQHVVEALQHVVEVNCCMEVELDLGIWRVARDWPVGRSVE